MKRFTIIAVALVFVTFAAFAARWMVDEKQPPPISLPDAYRLATVALGSATNQFHCTAARFVGEQCAPGSWKFDFYTTNGALKTVYACPDGSSRVFDGSPPIF